MVVGQGVIERAARMTPVESRNAMSSRSVHFACNPSSATKLMLVIPIASRRPQRSQRMGGESDSIQGACLRQMPYGGFRVSGRTVVHKTRFLFAENHHATSELAGAHR